MHVFHEKTKINTYTLDCENKTVRKQIALSESSKGYIPSKHLDVFIVWGNIADKQWNEVYLAGYGFLFLIIRYKIIILTVC